ncbi:hypothetical protein CFOUR_00840 [Corynebacterium fournieri]|nr:hypothetical protein CFOUR_00840 [Corynebacterium fournieri]
MHHLNSALTSVYLYAVYQTRKMRSDQGMSTIEYAFGSLAAAALAGVLYLVVNGDAVTSAIEGVITDALSNTPG